MSKKFIDAENMAQSILNVAKMNKDNADNDYMRGFIDGCIGVVAILRSQPPLDVAPLVRAEWIVEKSEIEPSTHCSNCGYQPSVVWDLSNYCPQCGAKMDLGEELE